MTNNEIANKGQEYLMNTYGRFPVAPVKGKGSYLWDANGKQYLDFVSGIAVCALGHSNNELNEVLKQQMNALWHVSNLYWIKPQAETAEKLAKLSGLARVFFCNSGAEANEAAIKLARKYFYRQKEKRYEIIVFRNSFHGRTLATVAATGQPKYQEGFAPLPEGFVYADYNQIKSVQDLISRNTCAVMLEPIQGEGGIIPAEPDFLKALRKLCDQEGLLLIFDEVQSGIGRTGSLFAYQQYGVKPDIATLAKGLGGGFPIGAMLANEKAANGFAPGDHASTFGGNCLATAVAGKVLDIIGSPDFMPEVNEKASYLKSELGHIADSRIVEIRGKGFLMGIEFSCEVKELIDLCRQKGLLVLGAGARVLRLVPPLTVSRIEINQAVNILKEALKAWI